MIKPMLIMVTSIGFMFGQIEFGIAVRNVFNFKYRIVKVVHWRGEYLPQVFRPSFGMFPWWRAVSTKYTFGSEYENVFGGKSYGLGYTTILRHNTEEEALIAIEGHKKEFKENRKKFYKRPKKKNSKTIIKV